MVSPAPHNPDADPGKPSGRVLPNMAWPPLARAAGRHAGGRFYDDLARLATGGACDAAALIESARRGEAPAGLDVRGLAWFAHVTASRVESPTRFEDVVALFELGYRVSKRRVFLPQLDDVWVQSAFLAGRLPDLADRLRRGRARPETWWAVETDAVHPGEVTDGAADWFDRFNRPYLEHDLEPVTVIGGEGTAFDRLVCARTPAPADGGRTVTVVVPVYNPGPSLRTAVRSLLAQTWPDLEIVLMDDCSSSGVDLIEELAAADPRVRHVRLPRNAGAYAARNVGIGVARSELVTFNDADDWAHPRKIERQVRALDATAGARASTSWSVRVLEDLRLTVIGRDTRRVNLSSVLMRRDDVLGVLGGFDGVRKGADSEFVERFRTVFGPDSIVEITDPLSLVQLTSGSLSRDDYQFLRTHPARTQYFAAFRSWHASLADADAAFVAPGTRAPFPAPPMIAGGPRDAEVVDVLLLANPSPAAPTVPDLAAEVVALADNGLRVGLRELISPFDVTARVRPPAGALATALRSSDAVYVPPADAVTAALTVVRDPAAVEATGAGALATLRAARALVIADYSPEGGRHYDPAEVSRMMREAVTGDVRWLPATAGIRDSLRALTDDVVLEPAVLAAVVPPPDPTASGPSLSAETDQPRPARRRVALYAGELDGQSLAELDRRIGSLVPRGDVELVGLGGGRLTVALEDRAVLVTRPEHLPSDDLFASVDIVVLGPSRGRGGHTHRIAALALRHGAAVVAGAEFREHFGDAACYLDEADVTTWVERLCTDPELFGQVSTRARAYAAERLSAASYARTISAVLLDGALGRAA